MPSEGEVQLRERLNRLRSLPLLRGARLSGELERLQRQLDRIAAEPSDQEIWRSVELARHPERPYTLDYVERMLEDFVELHGDRGRADDEALVTGLGRFDGQTVALIAFTGPRVVQQTTREKLPEDFGLAEQNLRFGHLDAILPRSELRPTLSRLLRLFDAPV